MPPDEPATIQSTTDADELRRRNAELALINSVQQGLATQLDMQAMYDLVGDTVRDVFDAHVVMIGEYNRTTGTLHYPYATWHGQRRSPETLPLGGLQRSVLETRQPLLIGHEVEQLTLGHALDGTRPRSALFVPLVNGDEATGVIALLNLDQEDAFSHSDMRLLSTLASSLSVAVENVRLFAETRRLLAETGRRAAELAVINSVGQALVAQLDVAAMIALVGREVGQLFNADVVFVALYDRDAALIRFPYYVEGNKRETPAPVRLDQGLTSIVVRSRQPLLLGTFQEQLERGVLSDRRPAESWLGVPILGGDDVLGVVSVQRYAPNSFSGADTDLLMTLAASLGVALENARLFATEQTQARRQAALFRLSGVLAAARDEEAICQALVDGLQDEDLGYAYVGVFLVDPFSGERLLRAATGLSRATIEVRLAAGQGLSERALLDGKLHYTPDVTREARYVAALSSGSEVDVPIVVGATVAGVLVVESRQPDAFGQADFDVLLAAATQAGVALGRARSLAEAEQRAAELAIINSVGEAMTRQLDVKTIARIVGDKVRDIFAAEVVSIDLLDQQSGQIQNPYYNDRGLLIETASLRPGESLTVHVIATGKTLLFGTWREMAQHGARVVPTPDGTIAPTESWLGVPLVVGERVLGAVSIESYRPHAFDERSVRLLGTLSANAGVAIENARLFEETRRRAREMAALAEVGREISASLELPTVLERIAARAQELLHGRDVVLRLRDPDGNLPAVVALGKYAAIYRDLNVRLGYGLTGHIAQTGIAEIVNDPLHDARVAAVAGTEADNATEAMIVAPLLSGAIVIGMMTVWRDKTTSGPFSQSDLDFIAGLTRHAAIAIENANLFAAVQRERQYFADLVRNSPVAIVTIDNDYQVMSWNPAAEALFGYHADEALGRNIDDLISRTADIRQDAHAKSRQLAQAGETDHMVAQRNRKDGSLVDVEGRAVMVKVEGRKLGYILIYHDITELKEAQRAAEQANAAKSTFLATMSHELRTPLNAIIGFTRIVRRKAVGAMPARQIENLDKVLHSAEHLLGLINTVLDIAKIEAGRMDVQPASFSPAALVDACLTTAQPLVRPGVALDKEVAAGLPPIFSDQDKVKQILLNLLSNAAKFTHQGTIRLRVRRECRASGGRAGGAVQEWTVFEVADSGIGISAEALGRIFEEFRQADTSTTRRYGGTGLGLSISRHLARLLGGDLTASSALDAGSTFTLALPARYGERPGPVEPALQPPESQPERPIVLAIDDDPDAIELLQEDLADAGYRVVGARDGDEGLRLAKALRPYAITLDIMMPSKDGWQVLHELKSDPITRGIPTILLTIVDKKALGYQLGAADYLVKPLDRAALLAALERVSRASAGAPRRLLVVDDDADLIDMVRQLLAESAYEIEAAGDGVAALEAIARRRPDVVLLDLMMPRLDGFGLIERLRERPEHAAIPIVVLTARELSGTEGARLRASVSRIIQKQGLEGHILLHELRRALER
jgi:PAS domain S-box-containing protein